MAGKTKQKGGAPTDPTIILNDLYQVKLSKTCMVLQKKIVAGDTEELSKEEKEDGFKNLGYFISWDYLGTVLSRDMQRDKLLKKEVNSVNDFLESLKETKKEIENIFKQIDSQLKVCKK